MLRYCTVLMKIPLQNSSFVSVMYFHVKQDMQQEYKFTTATDSILNVTYQNARLKAFKAKFSNQMQVCSLYKLTPSACVVTTTEKEMLNYYILMNKYNNGKLSFKFEMTCTDKSFTIRWGRYIGEVNRVNFWLFAGINQRLYIYTALLTYITMNGSTTATHNTVE